jgi:membrane-bound serine protease (ClpP class)
MLEFLLDPNVAYLTLVLAFLITLMAILTPGTAVFEILAVLMLIVSGWQIYNIPFNLWALIAIFSGVILFFIAVRWSNRLIFLALSILLLIIGSVFLFQGEPWWQPVVNPFLAIIISAAVGSFLWIVAVKIIESDSTTPTHDLGQLIGMVGEAKTNIHQEGSVQVDGELWTAHSEEMIPIGSRVRVVDRNGFMLVVEAADVESDPSQESRP